jgi:hypothetical protein
MHRLVEKGCQLCSRQSAKLSVPGSYVVQSKPTCQSEKSEAVLLSTTQHARASSLSLTYVNGAGCIVPFTDTVKLLGVAIDHRITVNAHVQNVCKYAFYHIRALKYIRSSLSTNMVKTVAAALVNSRLDYAHSVLYNTSSGNVLKLQRVQNSLARVITYTKRFRHLPVLHQLHWLPINYCINYK